MLPSVIDNQRHRLADVLNELLARCAGGPVDVATAYFSVSGYRLVRERLCQAGALRLLIGAEPMAGTDLGLRPLESTSPSLGVGPSVWGEGVLNRLQSDLATEPFSEATLRLVEDLIAFLRTEKVEVRLFDKGFLHAKAYLFHCDRVGPQTGRGS